MAIELYNKYETKKRDMIFTCYYELNNATHYHICELPLNNNDITVRDHCHVTGKYRGAVNHVT
jgi:hypothetical protein